MKLNHFSQGAYSPGASFLRQILWWYVGAPLVASNLLPFSVLKVFVLKLFGATLGIRVVIKGGVRVKFPWRLSIGDYSWIGESVWIDNLAPVTIGNHCCLSQGAYLCTGNHRWDEDSFTLETQPIKLEDHVWIAAKTVVAPGTRCCEGSVLTLGSVAQGELAEWSIYSGNPATRVAERRKSSPAQEKDQKKKILFVNQSFAPDESASAQYLSDITSSLAAQGHRVTVLTSRRGYLNRSARYPAHETIGGVEIVRVGGGVITESTQKYARAISALWDQLCFASALLRLPQHEVIVAMTSPPLIAWTTMVFARRARLNFVYWILDLNPDQAVAARWIREGALLHKLLNLVLGYVVKRSDRIVVLDSDMEARVVKHGARREKVAVQPLWIDPQLHSVDSSQTAQFRASNGIGERFVVMYSGNMSLCHPLDTLIHAARALRENSEIVFTLIGSGPQVAKLQAIVRELALNNVLFLPYQPRQALAASLGAADLHIVSMGEEYVGIVHPSKIYGILAMGTPFILLGPQRSFIGDIVRNSSAGSIVNHGDVATLAARISFYAQLSTSERKLLASRAHDLAINFEKEERIAALSNVMLG